MRFLKKMKYLSLILIIFSVIAFISISTKKQLPEVKPKDFNFVFNYGIYAKNKLDTFKGLYTKDMVNESSITIDFELTDEEINAIYGEMRRINIMGYPKNFIPKNSSERNTYVTPFNTYSIKMMANGKEKNITWKDNNLSTAEEAYQLRMLFKIIEDMINNNEEFKKLPIPQGHYN